MHPTYSQLCADHFNLLRLLRALEAEIACYEAGGGRAGRLSVILDIFDYVQVYPEKWHHPVEEALFEVLLRKQVENSELIWGMRAEHKTLESLTRHTAELFMAVANDTIVPIYKLADATREYIARQLDHINQENRLIYPLLEKNLTDEEWDDITDQVSARLDPLFNQEMRGEYAQLHRSVIRSERGVALGAIAKVSDACAGKNKVSEPLV